MLTLQASWLKHSKPKIAEQAATALANLSAAQSCREALVQCNGLPALVSLVKHSNSTVVEHAISAIGCLAGRDGMQAPVSDAGGISALVEKLSSGTDSKAADLAAGAVPI